MSADDHNMVLLFGSMLRFAAECPFCIDSLRILCQDPNSRAATTLELLLYAFYHCGVQVITENEDACREYYDAWHQMGTWQFVHEYVQPLCAAIIDNTNKSEFVFNIGVFIDRCTMCLSYKRLVRCRMTGCVCTFLSTKPLMSEHYKRQALFIFRQLTTTERKHVLPTKRKQTL